MRDFRSWLEPLIRLRHLLPARRGEKGNKARASRESCLLPLAPLAGRGCPERAKRVEGRVRGRATSDTLPSGGVSCPQSRSARRFQAPDDTLNLSRGCPSGVDAGGGSPTRGG